MYRHQSKHRLLHTGYAPPEQKNIPSIFPLLSLCLWLLYCFPFSSIVLHVAALFSHISRIKELHVAVPSTRKRLFEPYIASKQVIGATIYSTNISFLLISIYPLCLHPAPKGSIPFHTYLIKHVLIIESREWVPFWGQCCLHQQGQAHWFEVIEKR